MHLGLLFWPSFSKAFCKRSRKPALLYQAGHEVGPSRRPLRNRKKAETGSIWSLLGIGGGTRTNINVDFAHMSCHTVKTMLYWLSTIHKPFHLPGNCKYLLHVFSMHLHRFRRENTHTPLHLTRESWEQSYAWKEDRWQGTSSFASFRPVPLQWAPFIFCK